VLAVLYRIYQCLRALAGGDRTLAVQHAADIVHLARRLHICHEPRIQHWFGEVHLLWPLGLLYLQSHLGGTVVVLPDCISGNRPRSHLRALR
jgi:hypothetical protein